MLRTAKFRIYPNSSQEHKLLRLLELCRILYNAALEERISSYKKLGKYVSFNQQCASLKEIKELLPEYKTDIHSQILQDVLHRSDRSHQNFFRRVKKSGAPGFPRFKQFNRYKSFTYPQSGFSLDSNNRIKLSKIGHIKGVFHREITGKIKTCTISKSPTGKWYVTLTHEVSQPIPLPKTGKITGFDLGLKTFITSSDGQTVATEKFLNKHLVRLAKRSRKYSKNKTISNRKSLARIHEKIANCRTDFQHKAANELVKENDVLIFEDLNVKNMLEKKNQKVYVKKRNIADVSFGSFIQKISYKAEYAGKKLVLVDPRNTSKRCSCCGFIKEDLTLYDRIYRCDRCGLEICRDVNGAKNVEISGLEMIFNLEENRDIFSVKIELEEAAKAASFGLS